METTKKSMSLGIFYGGIAGFIWGTLGVFLTLMLNMGMSEVAVSSIGPMVVILFFGVKTLINNRNAFLIGWKKIALLLVGGGIANAVLFYSYSKALVYLSTGVFSILEFSHVFVLMLLTSAIFHYKITKGKILSLLLAIAGLSLVLNVFTPGAFISPMGILWMLANWTANCCNALIIKWALNKGVENDVVITYSSLGSAFLYWIVCSPIEVVAQIMSAERMFQLLLVIVAYGVITQILSSFVWMKSLSLVDPAITNMMNAFSPVTAAVLGFILFGQVITIGQIAGIAIVIGAVLLLNKTGAEQEI